MVSLPDLWMLTESLHSLNSMKTISIDLGGTRTKAGIVENGRIVASTISQSNSLGNFNSVIENLELQIKNLIQDNHTSEFAGIGIAMPGIIDINKNQLLSVNQKFAEAIGFDFSAWAKRKWGLLLLLENDARAALMGEWQFGSGMGYANICMMTFGTGIGTTCLLDGNILYGKHFKAGILGGHSTIDVNGDLCNCGNIGCVESLASGWRLKEIAAKYPEIDWPEKENIDFEMLFKYYRKGDVVAIEIAKKCILYWAAGIVNMVHAYDPELVILHGGIMKSADIILPQIKKYIEQYSWNAGRDLEIVTSSSVDDIALLGMHYKILEEHE
jgi:glucokinase